jgi:hypothetical protein
MAERLRRSRTQQNETKERMTNRTTTDPSRPATDDSQRAIPLIAGVGALVPAADAVA